MGTCCASRTDPAGKDKGTKSGATGKKGGPSSSLETKGGNSVKFNPMDVVRNTVTQVLKDSKSFVVNCHESTPACSNVNRVIFGCI